MSKYKHTQFNAGWWSCLCSVAQCDQRLGGMSVSITSVLYDAGVTQEEIEYVLEHNTVTDNQLKNVLIGYSESVRKMVFNDVNKQSYESKC